MRIQSEGLRRRGQRLQLQDAHNSVQRVQEALRRYHQRTGLGRLTRQMESCRVQVSQVGKTHHRTVVYLTEDGRWPGVGATRMTGDALRAAWTFALGRSGATSWWLRRLPWAMSGEARGRRKRHLVHFRVSMPVVTRARRRAAMLDATPVASSAGRPVESPAGTTAGRLVVLRGSGCPVCGARRGRPGRPGRSGRSGSGGPRCGTRPGSSPARPRPWTSPG